MKKVIGKSVISHEEIRTVICEIEVILNDQTIKHVSSDIDNTEPLTPADLLYGRKITSTSLPTAQDMEIEYHDLTNKTQSTSNRAKVIA